MSRPDCVIKVTGTLTFAHDFTGQERTVRNPAFTMEDADWITIVDDATERTHDHHFGKDDSMWFCYDDDGLCERAIDGAEAWPQRAL